MPWGDAVWPMLNSICHGNALGGNVVPVVKFYTRILVKERDCLVREEGVIVIVVNFCREMLDNGLGLHMQVSNHGVSVPSAKDLDEVNIHFSA
jgi:hypothetical protein